MEPGTKIAIISKSEGASHVAPSEKPSEKADPPAGEKKAEPPKAKVESPAETKVEKPKPKVEASPPPPRRSATEPQLPPKERERRVSLWDCTLWNIETCQIFYSILTLHCN